MLRFDSERQIVQRKGLERHDDRGATVWMRTFLSTNVNNDEVKSSKLLTRLSRWASDADSSVLDTVITPGEPERQPPGYFTSDSEPGFTLAEHLEYIADHSHVSVIGDAFRILCSWSLFKGAHNVREYLNSLTKARFQGRSKLPPAVGYCRTKEGWLFVRHHAYWRRLVAEIPESVLQPIEKAAHSKELLSSDDLASFVAELSDEQAAPFNREMSEGDELAIQFSPLMISRAFLSLRLWARLSARQRELADGSGLVLARIDARQREVLTEFWANEIWEGQVPINLWFEVFARGGDRLNATLKHSVANDSAISFDYSLSTGLTFGQEVPAQKKD
jgi:hypothetical protein